MASNAAKGAMLEARTVTHLRDTGWQAERVSRGGRFGGGDFLGCIDIVAVGHGSVELIQVTTKAGRSARRRKIIAAALGYPVRLIYWFKVSNRWAFLSEVVEPSREEPAAGANAPQVAPLAVAAGSPTHSERSESEGATSQ